LRSLAIAPGIGGDLIEAEDAYQHHPHEWRREKERLPSGLKGNILQAVLPCCRRREMYLIPDIGDSSRGQEPLEFEGNDTDGGESEGLRA
jgi:hypothetical protein